MGRIQFSIRVLLAAVAAVGAMLWLYQLGPFGPPMCYTLGAFLVLVVCPVLFVARRDLASIVLLAAALIICMGVLFFFMAASNC